MGEPLNAFTQQCGGGALTVARVASTDDKGLPNYECDGVRFSYLEGPDTYTCTISNTNLKSLYSGGIAYDAEVLLEALSEVDAQIVHYLDSPITIAARWVIPITTKRSGHVEVNLLLEQKLVTAEGKLVNVDGERPTPCCKERIAAAVAVITDELRTITARLTARIEVLEGKISSQAIELLTLSAAVSDSLDAEPPASAAPGTAPKPRTAAKPKAALKPVAVAAARAAVARLTRDINPRDELKASIARPGTSSWTEAQERLKGDQFLNANKLTYPLLANSIDASTRVRVDAVVDTKSFLGYVLGENAEDMRWRFVNAVAILIDGGADKLCAAADETKLDPPENPGRDHNFYCQFGHAIYDKLAKSQQNSIRGQYTAWKRDLAAKGL